MNVDDREPFKNEGFLKAVLGSYTLTRDIYQKLTELLFVDPIYLIANIRNNMKNSLMPMLDKMLLRKRSIIETVNDEPTNICQVEYHRHRSFCNLITNLIAQIVAYSFGPKKPAIKYQTIKSAQLSIFY